MLLERFQLKWVEGYEERPSSWNTKIMERKVVMNKALHQNGFERSCRRLKFLDIGFRNRMGEVRKIVIYLVSY